jgi:hypothetical protein
MDPFPPDSDPDRSKGASIDTCLVPYNEQRNSRRLSNQYRLGISLAPIVAAGWPCLGGRVDEAEWSVAMLKSDLTNARYSMGRAEYLTRVGRPSAATALWKALTNYLFDDYKPEKHYMRGPGPRWREKNNAPIVSAGSYRSRSTTAATRTMNLHECGIVV